MQQLAALNAWMSDRKKVVITIHYNPDADALGSSLALACYLRKKNHQVSIISPNPFPSYLDWMQGSKDVFIYSDQNKENCRFLIEEAELIFIIDFSAYARLQEMQQWVRDASAKKVVIDHHLNPNVKADYVFWNAEASSTAELIFDFIEASGDKPLIDVAMGECLYAGYVTDTSSFKNPSTTPRIHLITAELMAIGIQTNHIQRKVYDDNSLDKIRLIGYALKEKLYLLPEYKTAYISITQQELQKYGNHLEDTEGLVNFALSLSGTVLAVVFVDKGDYIRIFFRSVGQFAVNEFACKYFGGGGHINAAGANYTGTLDEALEKFLKLLPEYQSQLALTESN